MLKRKICIISAYAYIDQHLNYGSMFQYFALQKQLESMGYEPYWLRYTLPSDNHDNKFKLLIKKCLFYKTNKRTSSALKKMHDFVEKNCSLSNNIYSDFDELKNNCPEADIYLTGSDQVWGGELKANYLLFVPFSAPKIAYAASFGKAEISPEKANIIKPWLERFDFISVREKSAVDICKQMGIKAELVLDPTLFLNMNDYPAESLEKKHLANYIFGYFLNIKDKNSLPIDNIEKSFQINNQKLICAGGVSALERFYPKVKVGYYSPQEWLGMYRDADGIVTNTFHGVVFSIIFKKQFVVFLQKGHSEKQNERIMSVLKLFDLIDRIYDEECNLFEKMNQPINWENIEKKYYTEKARSLTYLKRAIEN